MTGTKLELFKYQACGTWVTGIVDSDEMWIKVTGVGAEKRSWHLHPLTVSCIDASHYTAKAEAPILDEEGAWVMHFTDFRSKRAPDRAVKLTSTPGDTRDFTFIDSYIKAFITSFMLSADANGFSAAVRGFSKIYNVLSPDGEPPTLIRDDPASGLTDEEIKTALGAGLVKACVPPARVNGIIDAIMAEIAEVRWEKDGSGPPPEEGRNR